MKIVKMSIRRPVTVTMLMVTMVLFGYVSYQRLPINLLPDISYPTLSIRTEYIGAAPEEVENLVTRRVEEAVSVANKVIQVSSRSRAGLSDVTVEFEWGTQMDFASLDVREKLDRVRLPQEIEKPVILRYDPGLEPIMRIGLTSDEIDLIALRTMAEERIKNKLETVDGVAAIEVSGGLEEEIHVALNERQISSLGLSIQTVASRVAAENINLTGGTLTDGEADYLVRTLNQYRSPEEIADIIVERRDDALIRLSDVAEVRRGFKDRTVITEVNGQENVELAVQKEADANTILVARRVKERLDEVRAEYGKYAGMELTVITDQSRFIEQSIREVLKTAILGGLLAIIVLYVFLQRLGATVIISLAIPICVMATFFFMYASGVSLNIMSLGGLALGVGMLVDNSIVVLESIDRYLQEGLPPPEAADKGATIVGKAVSASTLTTICVFLPIIFVTGVAGQLFTDQSLTVTYSLLASLLVALTLIPMMSSGFKGGKSFARPDEQDEGTEDNGGRPVFGKPGRKGPAWVYWPVDAVAWLIRSIVYWTSFVLLTAVRYAALAVGKFFGLLISPLLALQRVVYSSVEDYYGRLLPWVLGHRLVTIFIALAVLGSSLLLYPRLGTELIPEMSQNEILVGLKMPVGTPVERTTRVLATMERIAAEQPEVQVVYTQAGVSSMTGGGLKEEREDIGQMSLLLDGTLTREQEDGFIERLRTRYELLPGASVKFGRPVLYSYKTPVELEIRGYNLNTLKRISDEVVRRLHNVAGLTDIKSSTEGGNPEIQVRFDRDRIAALGLNLNELAQTIRTKVLGDVPTELHKLGRQVDIRVRVREDARNRLEDIRKLTVTSIGGRPIPLDGVADLVVEQGPSEIRRVDQERVAVVSAGLAGADLGTVIGRIDEELSDLPVPPEISVTFGGQGMEMQRSIKSMLFAIGLAIFLVYLVMASQFESLLHPFVILFTIPFGLVGVIWSLYLTTGIISVVALIGVVMLSGIVVNNAIVLIDYVNVLRRDEGLTKTEALVQAGRTRLRPILMTTATTILGLLPMAIGFGEGSEVRAPMAVVVIGGLLVGTFLTLLLLPTVYSVLDWRK